MAPPLLFFKFVVGRRQDRRHCRLWGSLICGSRWCFHEVWFKKSQSTTYAILRCQWNGDLLRRRKLLSIGDELPLVPKGQEAFGGYLIWVVELMADEVELWTIRLDHSDGNRTYRTFHPCGPITLDMRAYIAHLWSLENALSVILAGQYVINVGDGGY